eukprot:6191088-Pleurochrysis_carterae.AAC.1
MANYPDDAKKLRRKAAVLALRREVPRALCGGSAKPRVCEAAWARGGESGEEVRRRDKHRARPCATVCDCALAPLVRAIESGLKRACAVLGKWTRLR